MEDDFLSLFGSNGWPSRELSHIPYQGPFEDEFPFPEVGYVSFREGIFKTYVSLKEDTPTSHQNDSHLDPKKLETIFYFSKNPSYPKATPTNNKGFKKGLLTTKCPLIRPKINP